MVPRLGWAVLSVAGTAGRSLLAFLPQCACWEVLCTDGGEGGVNGRKLCRGLWGTRGGMHAPDLLTGRAPASSAAPQDLEEGIGKGI